MIRAVKTILTTSRQQFRHTLPRIEVRSAGADQTNLRDIPGIESLKILRIILRIEEHYDIELEEQVVFSVETIENIAVAVANLLAKKI